MDLFSNWLHYTVFCMLMNICLNGFAKFWCLQDVTDCLLVKLFVQIKNYFSVRHDIKYFTWWLFCLWKVFAKIYHSESLFLVSWLQKAIQSGASFVNFEQLNAGLDALSSWANRANIYLHLHVLFKTIKTLEKGVK